MSGVDRPRDRAPLAPLQPVRRVRRTGEKQSDCDGNTRGGREHPRKLHKSGGAGATGRLVDELV